MIRIFIGKCDCFPQAPHLAQAMVPGRIFGTRAEKVDPRVPWLYGFELDFRFR